MLVKVHSLEDIWVTASSSCTANAYVNRKEKAELLRLEWCHQQRSVIHARLWERYHLVKREGTNISFQSVTFGSRVGRRCMTN